ncbi:GlsB/YeaQ/YmgE family stress response membrane protein, partial [Bacillus spizizenii]|nr:GlsB/YeaQ/YmgE family stress response membrane protein [Bacillus spizizenii]
MSFIISLIVAIIIGWLGSLFVKGDMPGGIIGSMIA